MDRLPGNRWCVSRAGARGVDTAQTPWRITVPAMVMSFVRVPRRKRCASGPGVQDGNSIGRIYDVKNLS